MKIYPIHLRKPRSEGQEPSLLQVESEKLVTGMKTVLEDFERLKNHLDEMDRKYRINVEVEKPHH